MTEHEALFSLSLQELTISLGVSKEVIVEIVEHAIVLPQQPTVQEWQFDSDAIQRIRAVVQLHHDLGVNVAGAALVLELLEEIDRLHGQRPV
jgi:chaperone modulatory protein CbpM